jgi:acyl carrier protein
MDAGQSDVQLEQFKQEIRQIICRVSRTAEADLQDNLLVRDELGIDSIMAMEIVYACEKYMGIEIEETLFESVRTVGEFLSILENIQARRR